MGMAIARRLLVDRPARLAITALTRKEAEKGATRLVKEGGGVTEIVGHWGDVFVAEDYKDLSRDEILESPEKRQRFLDDLYAPLDKARLERFYLYQLFVREKPDIVIDCVNTATAIAYQNLFRSGERLRGAIERGEDVADLVGRHLATEYMPQLIRHVHILLSALRDGSTDFYLKVGTTGTGGMGLNVPFTHSEQRPSNMLMAKAGVAGAHSHLLFLLARTPGAPAVKEIKPAAAISWKGIGAGPILRRGVPMERYDATKALKLGQAFDDDRVAWTTLEGPLEAVYLDAGENGFFSRDEFETISTLGMMELVTPEDIADAVIREVRGQTTGLDIVSALDGAAMGPTYRGGVLRELALRRMEELENEFGRRSVAFEFLGPPRLTKLLFEAHLLERLYGTLGAVRELEPERAASQTDELVQEDPDLRVAILSAGLAILKPNGAEVLRGPVIKVRPPPGAPLDDWVISRGWVDLRPSNWQTWRDRVKNYRTELAEAPGPDDGSISDLDVSGRSERIRPGVLAAWILRIEDKGARLKR